MDGFNYVGGETIFRLRAADHHVSSRQPPAAKAVTDIVQAAEFAANTIRTPEAGPRPNQERTGIGKKKA
jgi:hypothetical protein